MPDKAFFILAWFFDLDPKKAVHIECQQKWGNLAGADRDESETVPKRVYRPYNKEGLNILRLNKYKDESLIRAPDEAFVMSAL